MMKNSIKEIMKNFKTYDQKNNILTNLIIIFLMIIIGVVLLPFLPDNMPIQIGFDGEVSNTAPKGLAILILPFLLIVFQAVVYKKRTMNKNIIYITLVVAVINLVMQLLLGKII